MQAVSNVSTCIVYSAAVAVAFLPQPRNATATCWNNLAVTAGPVVDAVDVVADAGSAGAVLVESAK